MIDLGYTPTQVQATAHGVMVDELLFGGAAGGGKSRWGRAEAVRMATLVPGSRSIIFRRTFPDLQRSVVGPLKEEIPQAIATYHSTNHEWTFANGSVIELAYLRRLDDVLAYQGAEYTLVVFEELTQFAEYQYKYMVSRLRAGGKVKTRLQELGWRPRIIGTTNPGGPGHHWVKGRFIDPAPPLTRFRVPASLDEPNPMVRCYVPARVVDNPHVDDSYRERLEALGGNLGRALLEGDWDVLEGVRFDQWRREHHVIRPEQLPIPVVGPPRAVGVDYGLSAPFAALWGAKLADDLIVVYRELYKPRLTPREQAELILASEAVDERRPERPIPVALDPATWARNPDQPVGKPLRPDEPPPGSIAAAYRERFGGQLVKARNERVGGWALIDEHLRIREDGFPRLLVYDTCPELIRTLPSLPRSNTNPEDVDTHAEDHLPDALRYLLQQLAGKQQATPVDPHEAYGRRAPSTVTGDLAGMAF